jgi:predicted MFS family arabinose efflux permease
MATLLSFTLFLSLVNLGRDLGVAKSKPKFSQIFSKSGNINILSAARLFLFGARDLWFVVALPVYLSAELGWAHTEVSSFLALWVIGYGVVQSLAPYITGKRSNAQPNRAQPVLWSLVLLVPLLTLATLLPTSSDPGSWLVIGLLVFGALFAINSSLHSYLIVNLADRDAVSLDVGFYYMANAAGRLIGTLLSGYLYQAYGLETCLWGAALFILSCTFLSSQLKFDGFAKQ